MAGGLLAGLLWKVAGTVLSQLEGKVVEAFSEDSLLYKAVRSTSEAFPEMEGVSGTLKRWCESDAFRRAIDKLREGDRDLTDDGIVQDFVNATGFYSGDQTSAEALKLLECFLNTIAELLYASDNGLAFHAKREEVLHAGTVSKIGALQESISLISTRLAQLTPSKNLLPSDDLGRESPSRREDPTCEN